MTLDQALPFTRTAALAAGITDRQLYGGRYDRIFTAVYVAAGTPRTPLILGRAAVAHYGSTAFASHTTAARIHELPIPDGGPEHVSIVVERHRRSIRGVTCHKVSSGRTWSVGGLPISEPRQVFVELASLLSLPDLVGAGDAITERGLATPRDLIEYAATSPIVRARSARVAASFVRPGSESPMESRARLLLALAGLPDPEINSGWVDDYGHRRRYDLVFRASRTIVEYDGRQHAENTKQWRGDILRRESLEDDGWRSVVLTARDVLGDPETALYRIFRILRQRAEPAVPRQPRNEWRRHFLPT